MKRYAIDIGFETANGYMRWRVYVIAPSRDEAVAFAGHAIYPHRGDGAAELVDLRVAECDDVPPYLSSRCPACLRGEAHLVNVRFACP